MKIFKYLLLLIPVLCITSCLHEEDDIFGAPPAIRMQEKITEYKSLLTDAPNGWIINFYPAAAYGAGGFAVYCKFSQGGKVEAACEVTTNVKPLETAASTWDVIPYQGPVLTFDTYNPVIHFFSEVTGSSNREGLAGDYDFVIMKAVKDTFYLSGVKKENKIVMWKASSSPIEYLKQVNSFANIVSKFTTFYILQNGDSIGTVTMTTAKTNNLLNRVFTAKYSVGKNDTAITFPFYYTPNELVLKKPLEIKGMSLQSFTWDNANKRYIAAGANIVLQYVGPKLYEYEDFIGNYKLLYATSNVVTSINRNRSIDVSIVPASEGSTYRILGILPDNYPEAELYAGYSAGKIEILGQATYTDPNNGYELWWLPYSIPVGGSNYVSKSTTYGVVADINTFEENGGKFKFNMIDNGLWSGYPAAGFILRNYTGSTNMGNVNGKDGQPYYFHLRLEKQ